MKLYAYLLLCPFILPLAGMAQSDNLALNTKDDVLMERLDVKLKNDSTLSFSTVKPFNRKTFTERIVYIDSLDRAGALPVKLSAVDRYDIRCFLMENNDFAPANYLDSFHIKHPILNTFYKTAAHMYSVDTKEFTLKADPVLNLQTGRSNDGTGSTYLNTRGIYIRGDIAKKLGYYTYISDNQERDPLYVQQWVGAHNAVPGVGFYKGYGRDGYDYFDFRGGISFDVIKYIHVQYAYDKLFIGNGFRSLELSDFANDYLFLRLNARLWKIDYEMIVAETIQSVPQVGRDQKPKNYMTIHHLSAQVAKWLNVGVYENIMESGVYGLQLSYLNPVIFYRATESNLGASGKANIAIDLKSNIARHIQLYGTILFNEFQFDQIVHYSDGSYANKQAVQGGIKYIDALGIRNLDLQGEVNLIRPFTYTNYDSTTNLTHYNQPLAHPLGANVREFIALARYQPIPRLYLSGKVIYYLQGLDSAGFNMGGDIFRSYESRPRDFGWHIGTGIPVHSTTLGIRASYELFDNAYIDLGATKRTYNVQGQPNTSAFFYSVGFRMNIQRREFDF
jgi:hypothetical protein